MNISIPLEIAGKKIRTEDDIVKSIDSSLTLLMQTPLFGFKADPKYGFVFKNLRFEMFNEKEGTINSADTTDDQLYKMKVSGTSKSINTFASELQKSIVKNEPRLTGVLASLTYVREEKIIYVSVEGNIVSTGEPYKFETTIKIWN